MRDAIRYAVNKVHSIDTTAELVEELSIINSIKFMRSADVSDQDIVKVMCDSGVPEEKVTNAFKKL